MADVAWGGRSTVIDCSMYAKRRNGMSWLGRSVGLPCLEYYIVIVDEYLCCDLCSTDGSSACFTLALRCNEL